MDVNGTDLFKSVATYERTEWVIFLSVHYLFLLYLIGSIANQNSITLIPYGHNENTVVDLCIYSTHYAYLNL